MNVLIATTDTPLTTELAIRSLLKFNKDLSLEIVLGVSGLCDISGFKSLVDEVVLFPKDATHGEVLDGVYDKVQTEYFLTMDSDIEVLEPGTISEFLSKLQDTPEVFAVSVEDSLEKHWSFPLLSLSWQDGVVHNQMDFVHQRRPHVYFCLWRNDDSMRRAVASVGFASALQVAGSDCKFWDTGGLLASVMSLQGRRYLIHETSKIIHYGSVSSQHDKYQSMHNVFKKRLSSYQPMI